jgi:hypothetical protein
MAALIWDTVGERFYETGVSKGVLYIPNGAGAYATGVAWNGLVTVTESPTGAEANAQYADNIKYLNLYSVEEFGCTIEAFTYPREWEQFDGLTTPTPGLTVGQQARKLFGLSYTTKVGNDITDDLGEKIHLVYGCKASPSEKAYSSVNDSPEPITFSWEVMTTPVAMTGQQPTALLTVDSRYVTSANLTLLKQRLYGTGGTIADLPLPDEVLSILSTSFVSNVTPSAPTFVAATGVITIVATTGVVYRRADTNAVVTGTVTIPTAGASLTIVATPAPGYGFSAASDNDWTFTRTP